MLAGWVNPHREQQTIPKGMSLEIPLLYRKVKHRSPPKSFLTPTAKSRPVRRRSRRLQGRQAPHTEHGLGVLLASETKDENKVRNEGSGERRADRLRQRREENGRNKVRNEGRLGASTVSRLCPQLLWCELYDTRDIHNK